MEPAQPQPDLGHRDWELVTPVGRGGRGGDQDKPRLSHSVPTGLRSSDVEQRVSTTVILRAHTHTHTQRTLDAVCRHLVVSLEGECYGNPVSGGQRCW